MMSSHDSTDKNDGPVTVTPINRLRGELCLPGDKSISHRAAMIASIAHGESMLKNFHLLRIAQPRWTACKRLAFVSRRMDLTITILGNGASGLQKPAQILNAQNSGTTMRLLSGILAGQTFETTITGDDSLLSRPMLRVAEPLRLMGAEIELETNGCAPLRIKGHNPLRALDYQLPIASAQIKSTVLLAGLTADGVTTVEEPAPTRDHTERLLSEFGAPIERNGKRSAFEVAWS